MSILKTIGNNVRGYRHKKDWTQEKLAERAKINVYYLGKLERGSANISALTMEKIANCLETSTVSLMIENSYKA